NVLRALHRLNKIGYALLRRQSAKIKNGSVGIRRWCFLRQFLEMWKDVNLLCFPPIHDQFVFYELAGSEKARYATLVCSELFVNICLCRQDECRSASSRVAVFGRNVPEVPCAAFFASPAMRHHVVAGTKQLEVISVIDDWNAVLF